MGKFRQLVESTLHRNTLAEDATMDKIIKLYKWKKMGKKEVSDLGRGRKFEIIGDGDDAELWFFENGKKSLVTSGPDDAQGIRDLKEEMHDFVAGRWRDIDDMIESNM